MFHNAPIDFLMCASKEIGRIQHIMIRNICYKLLLNIYLLRIEVI